MITFFERVRYMLDKTEGVHIAWCIVLLILSVYLLVLHHRWAGDEKKLGRRCKLCLIPFGITVVHYSIYCAGAEDFLRNYTPMYLIAVLVFVPVILYKRERAYKVGAAVSCVLSVLLGFHFIVSSVSIHNFTRKSYTESFHALVVQMDKNYVLKDWKEIDFFALEEKYMPLVEEAEREDNPAKFSEAVRAFCSELHDGHVTVYDSYDREKYSPSFEYHDFGLAMVQHNDGSVIAVCTEESVQSLGIHDGTVIVKWNGKDVVKAAAEDVPDEGIPVRSNAEKLSFIYLSATGGEMADVTFINNAGLEQTATLTRLKEEHTFDEVFGAFSQCPEKLSELYHKNYSTKMLDEQCGYIAITALTSGNAWRDEMSFYSGDSSTWAKKMFRRKLRALKKQGMRYLVIDLRNNMGGYDEIGIALCELLTDDFKYASGLGVIRDGEYKCISNKWIRGDGEFKDLKVVALTNYECISGGDVVARYLASLDNVTLAAAVR